MTNSLINSLCALLLLVGTVSCAGSKKHTVDAAGTKGLRILSYNIRNGIGMDNQMDYDRIAAVIKNVQPQVVALQELDSATERSQGVDVLAALAGKTGMHPSYGAAIPYKGGKYGVGVLSRERPLNSTTVPLPGKEEKRVLLMVEFDDYVLFCTHLSLTEADRLASARIINEQVGRYTKPVFLAGDLNALPESAAIGELKQQWQLLSGLAYTIPSTKPNRCIDYIFASKGHDHTVVKAEVLNGIEASDHLPLYVEVQ